jgi:hypothetical protein
VVGGGGVGATRLELVPPEQAAKERSAVRALPMTRDVCCGIRCVEETCEF